MTVTCVTQRLFVEKKKDLLLLNLLDWLWNLHLGRKVALYCSDVKGAFDRVDSERLKLKLRQKGLGGQLLEVVGDWLEERTAKVVVEGECSETAVLRDSIYQGTIWGRLSGTCSLKTPGWQ